MASSSEAEFQTALRNSKNIIVIAGAGLSAASGIPTFRGAGGLWRAVDATKLATPKAFSANPSICWQFYHYRREKVLTCDPNDAHHALARLSIPRYLKRIAPQAKSFHLITQNVDGLSRRALETVKEEIAKDQTKDSNAKGYQVASDSILEMHGKIFEVRCTSSTCSWSTEDRSSPLCPALGAVSEQLDDIKGALEDEEAMVSEKDLPHCPECGSLARPGVVWFGERPRLLGEINLMVYQADMCIVVGTSSTVYPAAGYAPRVRKRGGKVAVFNIERDKTSRDADFVFLGPCEITLPRALGLTEESAQEE